MPLNQKVDFLIQRFSAGDRDKFGFAQTVYFLFSMIGSALVGLLVKSYAKTRPPSFVLLSKKAESYRLDILKTLEHRWLVFFLTIALSIACGLAANVLYAMFAGK